MAIYWHVPGLGHYGWDERHGDCQWFVHDLFGKRPKLLCIDGYEGEGVARLFEDFKLYKANLRTTEIRFIASHYHNDHIKGIRDSLKAKRPDGSWKYNITVLYCQDPASLKAGLRDNKGSTYVKAAINAGYELISLAKARGVKVVFLKNKQTVTWGDLRFQNFREQPAKVENSDRYGDVYLNNGSLITWFPDLQYITSGDGPDNIAEVCVKYNLHPKMMKGVHHGNGNPRKQSKTMYDRGCWLYWDNDLSDTRNGKYTDFLMTGREDAIAVGMKFMQAVSDINGIFYKNKAEIYHGGLKHLYLCPYKGDFAPRDFTAKIVRRTMRGEFKSGDARVTKLITLGFDPNAVQERVNAVIDMALRIKSGELNFGKNEERKKNVDKRLGAGYGELVQDYINVLFKVKGSV